MERKALLNINSVAEKLGIISHKKSLKTIVGHKHFRQIFIKNLTFFMKKFQHPLILVHIWYEIADFEAKLLQNWRIDFEENGRCDQKMLLLKNSKVYIILFLL